MAQASLRNNDGNPFLYLETTSGSTAVGTDTSGADDIVKIVTGLTSNIEPTSAAGSIAIETTTPGDIEFRPKGTGQSTFVNGDVEITAGNLDMPNTSVGGTQGVINLGGSRFVHNKGTNNTFIGNSAGSLSDTSNSTVAIGANTLQNQNNLTGITAVGFNALNALTNGIQNTAVGYRALESAVNANQNTAVGYEALTDLISPGTGGGLNAAFGNGSLKASTIGRFNTALGVQSLTFLNGDGSNDIFNTGVGIQTGRSLTSGSNNTLVGAQAGVATLLGSGLTTGEYNTIVGAHSGENYTSSESSNIIIGNAGTVGESNKIRIGTQGSGVGQQNECFIAGINGVTLGSPVGTVEIDANGQLGVGTSGGGGGISWSVITGATQAGTVNSGYICNYNGTLEVTLPATAAVGTLFAVSGMFNVDNNWKIVQNGGQQIFFNTSATTVGASGYLEAPVGNYYSNVTMVCNVANTSWIVISSQGNITVN